MTTAQDHLPTPVDVREAVIEDPGRGPRGGPRRASWQGGRASAGVRRWRCHLERGAIVIIELEGRIRCMAGGPHGIAQVHRFESTGQGSADLRRRLAHVHGIAIPPDGGPVAQLSLPLPGMRS